jgi:hypothetical protein
LSYGKQLDGMNAAEFRKTACCNFMLLVNPRLYNSGKSNLLSQDLSAVVAESKDKSISMHQWHTCFMVVIGRVLERT